MTELQNNLELVNLIVFNMIFLELIYVSYNNAILKKNDFFGPYIIPI